MTAEEEKAAGDTAATEMLEAMSLLGEILAEENTALKAFKIADVEALQAQKRHRVRLYEHNIGAIAGNPQLLAGTDRDQEMKDASIALADVIAENERLLKANMEASKRLLNAIVDAAKDGNNAGAALYSREGTTAPATDGRTVSLTLNQTY